MISRVDTEALRPEEKDAILDAMLGMAWSDGTVNVDEIGLLKEIAGFFTDRDVEVLLNEYKPDPERVTHKIAASDLGPQGKRLLLRAMKFVAAAEGTVDDRELAYYRGCLRAFGVPERLRQRMEDEIHREVYYELLKKALVRNEYDDAAKKKLGEVCKRFNLDEATAAQIEERVRKELGIEPPPRASPPSPPPV